LTNIQRPNAGVYVLVVTNREGATASSPITLHVQPEPFIATPFQEQTVFLGRPICFSATVWGEAPFTYQWQLNTTNLANDNRISGADTASLCIAVAHFDDIGEFTLTANNAYGTANQAIARLSVTPVCAWGISSQAQVPAGTSNAVAIAAGDDHSLALRADGTVVAWGGRNWYGQTDVSPQATNVIAIAAGGNHSLALRADGTAVGWGINLYGQTDVPPQATNLIAIAAGYNHSLALRADGTVVGWGQNSWGQTAAPSQATNVIAIAAGRDHSLALRADGTVVAWGRNTSGQTNVPSFLTNVVAIAGGRNHSLALVETGRRTPLRFDPAALRIETDGSLHVRLLGASGRGPVIVLASPDLITWTPVFTNAPVAGSVDFVDAGAVHRPQTFYRAYEYIAPPP